MLTDLFFCHCTSTDGTYHCQFGKCARFHILKNICWRITLVATSLTKNSAPSKNRKIHKTIRLLNFHCNLNFLVFKHWCSLISKRNKWYYFSFYTCISEQIYHTGSAVTQYYYVCWLFSSLSQNLKIENT